MAHVTTFGSTTHGRPARNDVTHHFVYVPTVSGIWHFILQVHVQKRDFNILQINLFLGKTLDFWCTARMSQ